MSVPWHSRRAVIGGDHDEHHRAADHDDLFHEHDHELERGDDYDHELDHDDDAPLSRAEVPLIAAPRRKSRVPR